MKGPARPLAPPVVLVVDDEPGVLQFMARALREAGYEVHSASNGPAAIGLAAKLDRPPEVVVTDVRMDPMRGPALAELLFARGLAARFLFVSGFGPAADYNEEFGPLLPKPFTAQQLVEAVAKVIG